MLPHFLCVAQRSATRASALRGNTSLHWAGVTRNPQHRASTPPARRGAAAFFDLDKTIIAKSSAFAFSRQFLSNGLITPTMAVQLSFAQAAYMLHGHSSEQMDATRDQLAAMIQGWDVAQVRAIADSTLHSVVTPAIYAEARQLIADHKARGHRVVIVSASAFELVEPIARELGIDEMATTQLEIVDGRYTGNIVRFFEGRSQDCRVGEHCGRSGGGFGPQLCVFGFSD